MRQYRLPEGRSERAHPTRDVARAWTRAFETLADPELRLQGALSLAHTLLRADAAIVFGADGVRAGVSELRDAAVLRDLFESARTVLEDEFVTPQLYVARVAAERPERLALRWTDADGGAVEIARAIAATCAWAIGVPGPERAPGDVPDAAATLRRLQQLVHDARRMARSFAVVYVDVEPPAAGAADARDIVARGLRREVRANDHLGHLGGDAYVALLGLAGGESEAYPAAQRLLRAAAASHGPVHVGMAICPSDGLDPAGLVEKAGAAALAAASAGGTRPYWFREPAGRELDARAALRAELRTGDAVWNDDRRRWLGRHGATALTGVGLAAPMGLPALVRWATERRGRLGS